MEHVEQLPLVLVDPLDLDIKQGVRVDLHSMCPLQILCKTLLVILTARQRERETGVKCDHISLLRFFSDHFHLEDSPFEGIRGCKRHQFLQ